LAGVYTITYTATDPNNNSSTSYRTVTVQGTLVPVGITTIFTTPTVLTNLPQGTNVSFSALTTGSDPKTYQWYAGATLIPGETSATYSFAAQPVAGSTNVSYHVVVDNAANASVTSTNINIRIVADGKIPGLVLTSPKNNFRAGTFTIAGTATDPKGGNAAKVVYSYHNLNGGGDSSYTNDIQSFGPTPIKRIFTFTANNPPAGTNVTTVSVLDLAGNQSVAKVATVFYQVAADYALTISGDGGGAITATTKGGPGEAITGLPAQDFTGTKHISLYKHQLYTFTYAPDVKPTDAISSVVSNAPGTGPGTKGSVGSNTIKKVKYTFEMPGNDTTETVSFNRNRMIDMAGSYNGVFSVPNDPQIASSGLLQNLAVSKTGTFSAHVVNNGGAPTVIKGSFNADGTMTATLAPFTLTGYLDWANSSTVGGIKQFKGSVSSTAGWNADVTADRAEKNLLVAGKESIVIPGGTANGPTGSSFGKVVVSPNTKTFTFSLADNAVNAVASAVPASASSNFPIYVYAKYKATDPNAHSVLFGTWNTSSNQVTLNWIKGANGAYNTAGFSNTVLATTSAVTAGLTGNHTVTITNGAGAGHDLSYVMSFAGLGAPASKVSGPTNSIVVTQDPFGKLTVKFGNGNAKAVTVGSAGTLESSQSGAGFFIPTFPLGATDSGSINVQ